VKRLLAGDSVVVKIEDTIEVPASIYDWKKSGDPRAKDVQSANRTQFQKLFANGLAVLRYERSAENSGKFLLGYWDEALSFGTPEAE
jgi:hypothetical protein